MSERKGFFIRKGDYEKIERGCDLGDSVSVQAYLHPHRDDLSSMIYFEDFESHPTFCPPGAVCVTREQFRDAYRKAYTETWDDRDGLLTALERKLFGEEGE